MKKYIVVLSDNLSHDFSGYSISEYLLKSFMHSHNLTVHSITVVDSADETYDHIKKGWLNNGDR